MQLEQAAQEGREKHRILLAEAEGSSGGAEQLSDIVAAGRGRLKGSREGARGAWWWVWDLAPFFGRGKEGWRIGKMRSRVWG